MAIRRGEVTDIACGFACLEMKGLIANQHFYAFLVWHRHITTWWF